MIYDDMVVPDESQIKIEVGKRLASLRKQAKMRQVDVAAVLGISSTAYLHYENGRNQANYTALIALADLFNVSVDYILGREELPDEPNLVDAIRYSNELQAEERSLMAAYVRLNAQSKIALSSIFCEIRDRYKDEMRENDMIEAIRDSSKDK